MRYRIGQATLPGTPDVANKSRRWAIFVHGCFWHHHTNCGRATVPKQNRAWWLVKFGRNQQRDREKLAILEGRGLAVLVIWECETQDIGALRARLEKWEPLGLLGPQARYAGFSRARTGLSTDLRSQPRHAIR